MDGSKRVVSQVLIRNGRFAAVGNNVAAPRGVKVDRPQGPHRHPRHHRRAQSHRPGRQPARDGTCCSSTSSRCPRWWRATRRRPPTVPAGEFITTIGPIAAMQFPEQRLPNLTELDAVEPAGLHPRRAGRRAHEQPRQGVARGAGRHGRRRRRRSPANATGATLALRLLREQLADAGTRGSARRSTRCSTTPASASPPIATTARSTPRRRAAASPTRTPTRCTSRSSRSTAEKRLPARLRFNFLHQDPPTDPPLPTLCAAAAGTRSRSSATTGCGPAASASSRAAAWTACARSPRPGGAARTTR